MCELLLVLVVFVFDRLRKGFTGFLLSGNLRLEKMFFLTCMPGNGRIGDEIKIKQMHLGSSNSLFDAKEEEGLEKS